jgi:hypothetical protein
MAEMHVVFLRVKSPVVASFSGANSLFTCLDIKNSFVYDGFYLHLRISPSLIAYDLIPDGSTRQNF